MYPIPSYHPSEILQAKIRLAALEDRQTDAEILSRAAQLYFRIRQEMRSGRVIGIVEPDRKDLLAEEIVEIGMGVGDNKIAEPIFRASIEPPEAPADGKVRRIKDLTLFFVSAFILLTLVGFSVFVLTDACVVEEDRKWATSTLTTVFGGVLGWLIKR